MTMTILFSSAGRRNQLIECFRTDARRLGIDLRVLATDIRPEMSPACQQADAAFKVPRCTDPSFLPAMIALCQEQKVILLVPTIDPELAVFSEHAAKFAAVGTRVLVSAPAVVALANNKQLTADRLHAAGIVTPRTVGLAEYRLNPARLNGPVIAKPIAGSASIGIVRPREPGELAALPAENYIVQELWQGREYTVNVFFNQTGVLCCAVPHERIEVRSGEVSKGTTRRLPALEEAARRLTQALPGAVGALCFQAVMTATGEYAVFEINARFGGGYPLAHRAGARFSQWMLEEAAGRPVTAGNDWKEGVTMLRHDAAVFLNE